MIFRMFRSLALIALLSLTACFSQQNADTQPGPAQPTLAATTQPISGDENQEEGNRTEESETLVLPTATPKRPLAATVNGEPIYLDRFEKELSRYKEAQSQLGYSEDDLGENYKTIVLNSLIETKLISQAAAANGISVTPEMVAARIVELKEVAGGDENFQAWLQTNQMSMEEFEEALAAEMLTEKTVEYITQDVPRAVEQIHARYLQVDDEAVAQSLLTQLRTGADFASLAQQYSLDRITGENGGDLGFFARGSLLVPEIEDVAFSLQPGEISEVFSGAKADGNGTAYYLVQVIERDPQRLLTNDLLYRSLEKQFEEWLFQQWEQAEIIREIDL